MQNVLKLSEKHKHFELKLQYYTVFKLKTYPFQLLVKCVLQDNRLEVSGGGLGHIYSVLQFHFHWGSTSHDSEGSEHTVDSQRYPMEVHENI